LEVSETDVASMGSLKEAKIKINIAKIEEYHE